MKIKDKLLNNLRDNNDIEVSKILLDFGFKWFLFGLALGIISVFLIN